MSDELEEAEAIEAEFRQRAARSYMTFVRGLTIAGAHGPQMFDGVMADYQRKAFEDVAPSLQALRDGVMPPVRRFWWERTKKAGKDSDLATIVLWVIAFAVRPLYLQIGAANKEQAAIVKERISHLLHYNDWLNDHVEVHQWEVRSKERKADGTPLAKLDIRSSDIASAHGGTPDLMIINELSHVAKWEFVENMMDNADGVAQGIVMIATNAGYKGSKAEIWRNNALKEWQTHIWDRPAPWHDQNTVDDARRRNTHSRYQRLWQGKWTSGKGDALSEQDIERCFPPGAGPILVPESGWLYLGGLDLGISNDHAGGLVLGVNIPQQKLKVALYRGWEPSSRTGEVDLMAVEDWCRQMWRHYNIVWFGYDPFQAVLMAQRLRSKGAPMYPVSFQGGKNLTAMASGLMTIVETGKLAAYHDEDQRLHRDLLKMNIIEKEYGYKLAALRDEFGHADVGTALVVTLPHAINMLAGLVGLQPDDDVSSRPHEDPFSEEEAEGMPESLKDIYDLDVSDIYDTQHTKPRGWDD